MQVTTDAASTALAADTGKSDKKHRRIVVDGPFQWKYTLTLAIGVFTVASIVSLSMYAAMFQQAKANLMGFAGPGRETSSYTIFLYAMAYSSVVVLALVWWGILMTRRISGPVRLMQECLREMRTGAFPKRRPLRKHDEFGELFDEFWQTVEYLRLRRRYHATALVNMERSLEDRHRDGTENGAGMADLADQLKKLRCELAEAINPMGSGESDTADASKNDGPGS